MVLKGIAAVSVCLLLHQQVGAEEIVTLVNDVGTRRIAKYMPAPVSASPLARASEMGDTVGHYGFLVLSGPVAGKSRLAVDRLGAIRLLGAHSVQNGHVVYRAKFRGGLPGVRRQLYEQVPGFFNLVAVERQDRVSARLNRGIRPDADVLDARTGRLNAYIAFNEDVPLWLCDSILRICADTVLHGGRHMYTIVTTAERLEWLSDLEQVRYVREFRPGPSEVNAVARELSHVNAIQGITARPFPPRATWVTTDTGDVHGDSIWVGIYDMGVDSLVLDFQEVNSAATDSVARKVPAWYRPSWQLPTSPHGTHVAGIVAGNGWLSGTGYHWRGVAPKSQIASANISDFGGDACDVNNHSSTCGSVDPERAFYALESGSVDRATWPHLDVATHDTANIIV